MASANDEPAGIGRAVALARKLAGLTQRQLAERAHVSLSLVKQVETGWAPASPSFVSSVAQATGTSVAELLELPHRPLTRGDAAVHAAVPAIRREIAAYQLAPEPPRHRPLPQLREAVTQASRMRHRVDLTALGAVLPDLLRELRAAVHTLPPDQARAAYLLLAEAYAAANQLVYKLGHIDLASLLTDRYEWAAERSGEHLAVMCGVYQRAGELIGTADWSAALSHLEAARSTLEEDLSDTRPATLAMWGNLHLKSALAYARSGRSDKADDHLAEARQTAARIGEDRDDYQLCFGPTNVAIWSVALAVEAADGTTAVSRADAVGCLDGAPRERRGHHYIDLARGWLLHGDRDRAFATLLEARSTAPQQTRYHPMVHETLRGIAARDRRRSDSLAGFARWAGVTV